MLQLWSQLVGVQLWSSHSQLLQLLSQLLSQLLAGKMSQPESHPSHCPSQAQLVGTQLWLSLRATRQRQG